MKSTSTETPRMFHTRNDLGEDVRERVITIANQRLADCIDLQTQCKQAHWNVKGAQFIGLHELFDQINEAVEDYVDLIAERVVQLGGVALGTARFVAAHSELDEYPLDIADGMEHVDALSTALSEFGQRVRASVDQADELGDKDTADLFTEVSRGIDKWLWFVEAHHQVPSAKDLVGAATGASGRDERGSTKRHGR